MVEDLQKQLYDKYPEIFRQKDLPMNQTAMMWGICCGKGWYNILDTLCDSIQNHIDNERYRIKLHKEVGKLPPDAPDYPQIEFTQVKEKYGGLRVYLNHYDGYVEGLVHMAEMMSYSTCEYCGNPGKPNEEGWITTLCQPCRDEDDARRNRINEEARERLTIKMKDVTVAP